MTNLSAGQLRHAADLQDRIESLKSELAGLLDIAEAADGAPRKRRKMSAAARARIAAAQRARWAKQRGEKPAKAATKPKRKMSAAGRARIAAAARARWAKAKAAGKNRL